jgi:hypothetical protein
LSASAEGSARNDPSPVQGAEFVTSSQSLFGCYAAPRYDYNGDATQSVSYLDTSVESS